jgi:hypothetical protein
MLILLLVQFRTALLKSWEWAAVCLFNLLLFVLSAWCPCKRTTGTHLKSELRINAGFTILCLGQI